ncbi:MAG: TIGR03643 family protein [Flavobacteriaceae bacterium]
MKKFTEKEIDRIIEMAWEDRTPFEAIYIQFNLSEKKLIELMRKNLKLKSFKMWRSRIKGNKIKNLSITSPKSLRFRSKQQKIISNNKISKR